MPLLLLMFELDCSVLGSVIRSVLMGCAFYQTQYDVVTCYGYRIDVRGAYPILIYGMQTWDCVNWYQALELACLRVNLTIVRESR